MGSNAGAGSGCARRRERAAPALARPSLRPRMGARCACTRPEPRRTRRAGPGGTATRLHPRSLVLARTRRRGPHGTSGLTARTPRAHAPARPSPPPFASRDFHTYRHSRRAELDRLERIEQHAAAEAKRQEFDTVREERAAREAEKTSQRAAKRAKKKAKRGKGGGGKGDEGQSGDEGEGGGAALNVAAIKMRPAPVAGRPAPA